MSPEPHRWDRVRVAVIWCAAAVLWALILAAGLAAGIQFGAMLKAWWRT